MEKPNADNPETGDWAFLNYRIFNSNIDRLCDAFTTKKPMKNTLKKSILEYFIINPDSLKTSVPENESIIVSKIGDLLRSESSNGRQKETIFLIIYEHILSISQGSPKRASIFKFLYNVAGGVLDCNQDVSSHVLPLPNLPEKKSLLNVAPKEQKPHLGDSSQCKIEYRKMETIAAKKETIITSPTLSIRYIKESAKGSVCRLNRSCSDMGETQFLAKLFFGKNPKTLEQTGHFTSRPCHGRLSSPSTVAISDINESKGASDLKRDRTTTTKNILKSNQKTIKSTKTLNIGNNFLLEATFKSRYEQGKSDGNNSYASKESLKSHIISARIMSGEKAQSDNLSKVNHHSGQVSEKNRVESKTACSSPLAETHVQNTAKNEEKKNDPITASSNLNKIHPEITNEQRKIKKIKGTNLVQCIVSTITGVQDSLLKKTPSGKFMVNREFAELSESQAKMLLKVSELGTLHNKLKKIIETPGEISVGLYGQSLVSRLRHEITKYYGGVAKLQENLRKLVIKDKDVSDVVQQNGTNSAKKINENCDQILSATLNWASGPHDRLHWLYTIVDACRKKTGGALINVVHSFLLHSDVTVHILSRSLLMTLCVPFYKMLVNWLLNGELQDNQNEFFIYLDTSVNTESVLSFNKYKIRSSMLPAFVTKEFAEKALDIGKNINFLSEIHVESRPKRFERNLMTCIERNPEYIFVSPCDTELHEIVNSLHCHMSHNVFDIVVVKNRLYDHLNAIRRYLLVAQGDFITELMRVLRKSLDKPPRFISTLNIDDAFTDVVSATNSKYEDGEILKCLKLKLLKTETAVTGWDVFTLHYDVKLPLAPILSSAMPTYYVIFNTLWHMLRVEYVCSAKMWKEQMIQSRNLKSMSITLKPILYRFQYILGKMNHFIHQLEYYFLNNVIESSWNAMKCTINNAMNLDEITVSHDYFLRSVCIGLFRHSRSINIYKNLLDVYDKILKFDNWQCDFFKICKRQDHLQSESQKDSSSSLDGSVDETERIDLQKFCVEQKIIVEMISEEYEKAVRQFLVSLIESDNPNNHSLAWRLDPNNYENIKMEHVSKIPKETNTNRMDCTVDDCDD